MIELHGQIAPVRLHGQLNKVPSESSGGPLQSKTAWPSHSQQIITPDDDYYGLASVKVEPVPRLPACVASFAEGIHETVENVVNIAAVVSVNGVTWTHSLYGGVRLPNIPEDVLAQYPYIFMLPNKRFYAFSVVPYWYPTTQYPTCMKADGPGVRYDYNADTDEWELKETLSSIYIITPDGLLWSNYNVPNGSATATSIYFKATNPVPTN